MFFLLRSRKDADVQSHTASIQYCNETSRQCIQIERKKQNGFPFADDITASVENLMESAEKATSINNWVKHIYRIR